MPSLHVGRFSLGVTMTAKDHDPWTFVFDPQCLLLSWDIKEQTAICNHPTAQWPKIGFNPTLHEDWYLNS